MPLVSVVIPVYNGEKTIRETIESVLKQTLSDIEIIIINDGSQDGTLAAIEQIQDPRLTVFSYPNSGLSTSRNRGIALANADLISFIDADDLWTADKLEAQVNALKNNPKAALAYSWTDFIDENSHVLHSGYRAKWSGNVYEKLLTYFFLENGSNALVQKQVFSEVGDFDESLKAVEDWDFFLRAAARYEFAAVPAAQVLYRQPASSMSSNVVRQESESLKVITRAFEQAPQSLRFLKSQTLANLYQYLLFKAIAGTPSRSRALTAARFLGQAVFHNPQLLLHRARLMAILSLKIAVVTLLPQEQAKALLKRRGNQPL